MLKIALLGIVIVLLALPFRLCKGEYSLYISLAGCCLIFYFCVGRLQEVLRLVRRVEALLPLDSGYIGILLKMVGIAYITEFSGDICKDAGFSAVASQIGIAGKLTMLGMSVPILTCLLEQVTAMWGR